MNLESYEQERSKFLSTCDEWYRVLEPRGLMNIEQRELLREWISTRQYANTEDPIVSLVIEKCSEPKREEEEKKWREAEKMREELLKEIQMASETAERLQDLAEQIYYRKSRDGHRTNASLSTDFFHTQPIQIKHDRVRWLSLWLPIPYRISGI